MHSLRQVRKIPSGQPASTPERIDTHLRMKGCEQSMLNFSIPPYLLPVYQVLEGARVRAVPDGPEERDGVPKTNTHFPGCNAWKIQVSMVMSEEEDEDGSIEKEVRRQSITVWSPERPSASVGDRVRITGLMAGAVEGSLFLQATGVENVEETSGEIL